MTPEQYKEMQVDTKGGVWRYRDTDRNQRQHADGHRTIEDTPAYKAGIKAGLIR